MWLEMLYWIYGLTQNVCVCDVCENYVGREENIDVEVDK